MNLNGFAGRTVKQVEREDATIKVVFDDGGYLFVRARNGTKGARLRVSCSGVRCKPAHCEECRGIEQAPSE